MMQLQVNLHVYSFLGISKQASKKLVTFLLAVIIIAALTGCSRLNCTRFEDLLGRPTDLVEFSYTIADNLTTRALPPLIPQHPDMPIVVTTFVDNNDLNKTSQFGRVIQEHIISRLVQIGYTVQELKAADTLTITPGEGETILTRDLSRLKGTAQSQAILVGTVSRSARTLYISTRLIDPATHNIMASDDYRLCMDDDILAMFGLQRRHDQDTFIKEPGRPLF